MLERFIASRRKPHYIGYPRAAVTPVVGTMMSESARREAIIKAMAATCTFKVHDLVEPWSEKEFQELGQCRVTYIADTYVKFGKHNEWPKNDQPMIVTVWSEKQKKNYLCTPVYLKKKEVC